jgi:hypothetical protein
MHAEVGTAHVVHQLLTLAEVSAAVEAAGVHRLDVTAVLDQVLAAEPVADGEDLPPVGEELRQLVERSVTDGRVSPARLTKHVAAALPPPLAFLRGALAASSREVERLDVRLPQDEQDLTLEGWAPELRGIISATQRYCDTTWRAWAVGVTQLFLTLLVYKPLHDALRARDVDTKQLLREYGESLPTRIHLRTRPTEWVTALTPALYATLVRAERLAAADRRDVSLRHLLAAMHADPEFAPWIERIAG